MTMNTEYSKEMIEFAEDVADMMALRDEYLKMKAKLRIYFGRVDGEDVEEAYHNFMTMNTKSGMTKMMKP